MNEILWKPKNVNKTKLKDFTDLINDKYALDIDGYQELYKWSIKKIPNFWSEILDKYETKIPGYGLIRLRLIGCKGVVESFDIKDHNGIYNKNIVLDLDYWAAIPT